MRRSLLTLAAACGLGLAMYSQAQAGLITFSDLPPADDATVPADYSGGLPAGVTATWSCFAQYGASGDEADHTADAVHIYVYPSSDIPGYTGTATITFSAPVQVPSLFIRVDDWCQDPSVIEGYSGGQLVWSSPNGKGADYVEITAGAGKSIDELRFAALWTAVDDITVTAVPEPTSLALVGVVSLGLMRRRRV